MGSSNNKQSPKLELYSFQARIVSVLLKESCVTYSTMQVPKGRSGHRITVDDSFMYTFGGYNPMLSDYEELLADGNDEIDDDSYRLFKEIWRFNLVTKEWTLLDVAKESFPNELASTVVEMVDTTMIVHGGTGIPFGVTSSNSTYAINLKVGKSLTRLNTIGKLPDPMYGQGSFLDTENMKLYLVGGTSGLEFFMDVHCLDLGIMSWSLQEAPQREKPGGRYRHEICVYDSKIIVFGGGTIERAFDFQSLPAFDLKTNRWQKLWTKGYRPSYNEQPKFPAARRCHGGILVPAEDGRDAEYIICGGFNGRRSFSDIWSLNLRRRQWYKWSSSFPRPLYFHACALTPEGKLIVFGGVKSNEGRNSDPVIEYPDRTNQILSCWVKIPKLSEMSWEALLHYAPDLPLHPSSLLLSIGVPRRFVERISSND